MASPQGSNLERLPKLRRTSALAGVAASSLQDLGDAQAGSSIASLGRDPSQRVADVLGTTFSGLEEPPSEQDASSAVQAEGRPPPSVQAEGSLPQDGFKWNFSLGSADTLLTLPVVSSEWKILEPVPSEEPQPGFMSKAMMGQMVSCVRIHHHHMTG